MKFIQLTQDKQALVDDKDFEWLNQWKWSYNKRYARRNQVINGKKTEIKMHRLITNPPLGMVTDHINHNTLDNRRQNLRVCTHSQNIMNSKIRYNSSTGYKGVQLHKQTKKYRARITVNGCRKSIGLFNTPELAYSAYKTAAKIHYGEYAFFD